jgi:hypothetical protein
MLKLKELELEWKTDAKFNVEKLDEIISGIPSLHAKYISILSYCKSDILKFEKEFLKMRRLRTEYYNGSLDKKTLDEYGWEQWQEKKPLKTVLDALLESDDILIEHRMKIQELTICKDFLESVMKSIGSRTYDAKNYMDYLKWSQGVV